MGFSPSTLSPFPANMIGAMLVANTGTSSVINIYLAQKVFGAAKWTLWPSSKFKNSCQGIISWLHLKSFRNMSSLFSAPTNTYLLRDGFKKVSYILVGGLRRNVLAQFAGPTSRMLQFFPRPNSSRLHLASAKTHPH